MPTRIKSDADLFVQNELDIAATANDGSETGKATRLAQINPDLGLAQTRVDVDGDLRTIDTAGEAIATSPTANSAGASSASYSSNFLLRWAVSLLQAIASRLPSALGSQTAANSLSVAIASNDSLITAIRDRLMPQGTAYAAIGSSAGANIKNSPGVVYTLTCTNLNSSIRWFQLFDKTSAPSNAETPIRSFPVYGNGGFLVLGSDTFSGAGVPFATGITFGFSTTALTYTAGTATDAIVSVRYS